jgi:hypothetical protein
MRSAKEFAETHELEIVEIIDSSISAFKGRNLNAESALGGFISAVEAGAIERDSWLYVENLDRLSRQEVTKANELFLRLLNLGLTVVTGMDNKIYTSRSVNDNPTDLMLSILLFSRANEESRTKQKRTYGNVTALVERHKQGLPVNIKSVGKHPWWIDDTGPQNEAVKQHPKYWSIARDVISKYLEGAGVYTVKKYLTEKYPDGMDGKEWDYQVILRTRTNRALIGERNLKVAGNQIKLNNYYPALCTETEFARLQDLKNNNKFSLGEKNDSIKLLSGLGLLRCGKCNGTMNAYLHRTKPRYICTNGRHLGKGCVGWSMNGLIIDQCLMIVLLIGYLDQSKKSTSNTEVFEQVIGEKEERLKAVNTTLDNLLEAIEASTGNLPTLIDRMTKLEVEKSEILVSIDRIKQKKALVEDQGSFEVKMVDFIEMIQWGVIVDSTDSRRTQIRQIIKSIMEWVVADKIGGKLIFKFKYKGSDSVYTFEGGVSKPDWHLRINFEQPKGTMTDDDFRDVISRVTPVMHEKLHSHHDAIINAQYGLYREVGNLLEVVGYPLIDGAMFWPVR